jgi:hypothetical protein
MKRLIKTLSVILSSLICLSVITAGVSPAFADTSFDEGDFRFTLTSNSTVMVSKYYGDDKNIILPEYAGNRLVTGIYKNAFENSDVVNVTIPSAYSAIGDFAFSGCTELEKVYISSGMKSIGVMAFYGCESLKSIDLRTSENLTAISFAAFSGCSALEKIEFPDTLSSLGENAFSDCSSLAEVNLPKDISYIPEYAFYNCTSLNEVFIPESVTSIGENAFAPMTDNGDIDVICYTGAYAAQYCQENEIQNLVLIDEYIGDANRDGHVTISDVTEVQRYLASIITDAELNTAAADVDGDGTVTIYDAVEIQRFLAKFPDLYHIGYTSAEY